MLVKTLSTQVSAIAKVMNSFLIGFFYGSRVELVVVVDGRGEVVVLVVPLLVVEEGVVLPVVVVVDGVVLPVIFVIITIESNYL